MHHSLAVSTQIHYRIAVVNVAVTCAGVRVNPGDIIVAAVKQVGRI